MSKYTGVIRTYYDAEERFIKEKYFAINGVKEGPYTLFYKNGRKNIICNYVHDKREGKCIEFYEDGMVGEECYYVNNRRSGLSKRYFQHDGTLASESEYLDGDLHGKRKEYSILGGRHLKLESTYVRDIKHGIEIRYHPYLNRIINTVEYRDDEFYREL